MASRETIVPPGMAELKTVFEDQGSLFRKQQSDLDGSFRCRNHHARHLGRNQMHRRDRAGASMIAITGSTKRAEAS